MLRLRLRLLRGLLLLAPGLLDHAPIELRIGHLGLLLQGAVVGGDGLVVAACAGQCIAQIVLPVGIVQRG